MVKISEVKAKNNELVIETTPKKFGLYSSHVVLPGDWTDKKVEIRVIGEE